MLRGGDIDLLIISEKLEFKDKVTILAELKALIGDQKIDLVLSTKQKSKTDPFIESILKQALALE